MSFFEALYRLILGPLELLFDVIYAITYQGLKNPGLSIVFLSLAINVLLLPLYKRADAIQDEEREKSILLKPRVDRIRKAFQGDERYMILREERTGGLDLCGTIHRTDSGGKAFIWGTARTRITF